MLIHSQVDATFKNVTDIHQICLTQTMLLQKEAKTAYLINLILSVLWNYLMLIVLFAVLDTSLTLMMPRAVSHQKLEHRPAKLLKKIKTVKSSVQNVLTQWLLPTQQQVVIIYVILKY